MNSHSPFPFRFAQAAGVLVLLTGAVVLLAPSGESASWRGISSWFVGVEPHTVVGVSLLAAGIAVLWSASMRQAARRHSAALIESESRFRQMADSIREVFWLTDPDKGTMLYVSPAFEVLWGRTCAELYARPLLWLETVHPEDQARVRESLSRQASGAYDEEYRVLRPDGGVIWVRDRAFPVLDERGVIFRIAGIAADVSARHASEDALRQAEMEQRALADQFGREKARLVEAQKVAKVGSWETDLKTGGVIWSEETHRIFETDPALFEVTHDSFLARVHPADRQLVSDAFERSVGHGEPSEIEHRIVVAEGSKIVRERWQVICGPDGSPVRATGTCQDVTERKRIENALRESEAGFRALFEQAGIGIALVGLDNRLLRCNARLGEMLGYSVAELSATTVEALSDPGDQPDREFLPGLVRGEASRFELEKRYRRKNGDIMWGWLTVTVVRAADGKADFFIGMVEDISARKIAERELREAEARLHTLVGRLNSTREDEAKRIARDLHDNLGQQLTALNLELDRLERKLPDLTVAQRGEFERLHTIVDESVGIVQKISGELRHAQLDLLGLAAAIEWKVGQFSAAASLRATFTRLTEIPDVAEATGTAVLRILQEALTNIARHAGASQVTVTLALENAHLVLVVRDNGRGITSAEATGANAIGLLGMRERALLAGGECRLIGRPNQGTEVIVRVPASPPRQ